MELIRLRFTEGRSGALKGVKERGETVEKDRTTRKQSLVAAEIACDLPWEINELSFNQERVVDSSRLLSLFPVSFAHAHACPYRALAVGAAPF